MAETTSPQLTPARRTRLQLAAALAVVAGIAALAWLVSPSLRARGYLLAGSPRRAWEAALKLEPGEARDLLLRQAMLTPVADQEGRPRSAWDLYLAGTLADTRDPREPEWVMYGPFGKDVIAYTAQLRDWPWFACGAPRAEQKPNSLGWRWIQHRTEQPDRRHAETDAGALAQDLAREALGHDPFAGDVAAAVAHLVGAGAFRAYSGTETDPRVRAPADILRRGHFPVLTPDGNWACVNGCDLARPAAGVTEEPDGTLRWQRGGTPVVVPPTPWGGAPPAAAQR